MEKWRPSSHVLSTFRGFKIVSRQMRPIITLLLLCIFNGCGGGDEKRGAPGAVVMETPPTASEIKRYKAEELGAVGDEFLIDESRVEIAPPVNWNRLSKSDKYLVCFTRTDRTGLPRITLTAQPFSSAIFTNLTEENLVEFAKFRHEDLTGGSEPVEMIESVRPLMLGGNPWIRYVRPAAFRNTTAERQILETIHEGRLYQLELQVTSGTLTNYRDAAYAVAARLRFVDPSVPAPTESPPSQPPETPAGTAP